MDANYEAAMQRGKQRWGTKFVPPVATHHQQLYFNACRVEITSADGEVRRGRISITTGCKPSLLLMPRRNSMGSSDLIDQTDAVTAWIDKRGKRHPIDNAWKQAMREHAV